MGKEQRNKSSTACHSGLGLAAWLAITTGSAAGATQERIGGWLLHCPGNTPAAEACVMRLDKRFLDNAGITVALEVQRLGKTLVPVIVLRGLSTEMLMATSLVGTAKASLRFDDGPRQDLACVPISAGYICSPRDQPARTLAAALPAARSVTVRVSVAVAGMSPLPARERSLKLSGTKQALARLRMVGPTQVPATMTTLASAPRTPGGLIGMADKALKAAGYQHGVAGLQALLAGTAKK